MAQMSCFPVWRIQVLSAFFVWSACSAELLRGPYLQMGNTNSVTIKWRSDEPTDTLVRYGTNLTLLDQVFVRIELATDHEARLTGLLPKTKYYYAVGSSDEILAAATANQYVITHPQPGNPQPTRIWVIGDSGSASAGDFGSHLVRDAYLNFAGTNHTDVWLMLGDNAYYSGTDAEYQIGVFETYPMLLRNTILWSTLGNHETYGPDDEGRIAYHDIFTLPANGEIGGVPSGTENYYSFDYANIHFVCLDSELSGRTRSGAMYAWLEQDLQANTNEWLIAFWHSPPYSKGSHNSDNLGDNLGNMTDMRTNFVSLLEAYGVDLVMSGHSHIYERSFLINGHYGFSTSLQSSMIRDGGSGRPDDTGPYVKSDGAGAVYVVAGSSGWATFRTGHHPIMYYDELVRGSLVLDINGSRLDAKFLRETGNVDDYFTLLKNAELEPLRIRSFTVADDQVRLRWRSVIGRAYRVQSASNLESPDWDWASPPIIASGLVTSWEDLAPAANQQFYRIVEQ